MTNSYLTVSDEVAAALAAHRPVVALETTIVSHGMPWPENFETAKAVEADLREVGAVPAAIAVMNGSIRVGLDDTELETLARADDVLKLSRADLAYGLTSGRRGATTVAATMMAAHMAGIEVFATGGIGGVHRGAETSFDISTDLTELGRTNVIVVCAGAKAILDIPKTLEVLETEGVPVIGYRSDTFPAFWSSSSGLPTPLRLDSPSDIAAFATTRAALGPSGGILIANPVAEADQIPADEMRPMIEDAVAEAADKNIRGKDVTPFLLDSIFRRSGGRSLTTNIALVRSNARLAGGIAAALAA